MKTHLHVLAIAVSCLMGAAGCDRNEPAAAAPTATKPDNTAMNRTDQNTGAKTPMDQAENSGDIKITADIRRAVMDDKSLSTDAHNAKIVTAGGMVTLRGVVDNAGERDAIEAKARSVGGVTGVDDQLTVKNP